MAPPYTKTRGWPCLGSTYFYFLWFRATFVFLNRVNRVSFINLKTLIKCQNESWEKTITLGHFIFLQLLFAENLFWFRFLKLFLEILVTQSSSYRRWTSTLYHFRRRLFWKVQIHLFTMWTRYKCKNISLPKR